MAFQRGDVVLVPIPFTDLQTSKVRPAVVLSSPTYHATEPDLILGAITTNLAAATAPVDYVLVDDTAQAGYSVKQDRVLLKGCPLQFPLGLCAVALKTTLPASPDAGRREPASPVSLQLAGALGVALGPGEKAPGTSAPDY